MSDNVEERLQKLEEEILRLRSRQKTLFNIVDTSTDKEPFMRLMISVDATEEQETAVYDLMNEVDEQITRGSTGMDTVGFRDRVYKVFPNHRPQQLAESIVMRLAKEGGWDQVYEHLRKNGMNLRDLREERGY